MKKVIIVGGGVSGISATMHLLEQGYNVTMLEKDNSIGGRCASFGNEKWSKEIDMGQHLFSEAYENFFEIMKWLGNEYKFSGLDNGVVHFINMENREKYFLEISKDISKVRKSLSSMKHIGFVEKIGFAGLATFIKANINLKKDQPLLRFLQMFNFSKPTYDLLWNPLVSSLMNVDIEQASTALFLNTIKELMKVNNVLLKSDMPLAYLFTSFEEKLNNVGASLILNTRVDTLVIEDDECKGIVANGKEFLSDAVIFTGTPKQLDNLYNRSEVVSRSAFSANSSAIISMYLWLDKKIMDTDAVCITNSPIEWLFAIKYLNAHTYCYNVTLSAASEELIGMKNDALIELVMQEITKIADEEVKCLVHCVLKYKNATSLLTFENNHLRPKNRTSIKNFFIAGDWTQTGLPATIESAAKSGAMAANEILNALQSKS